ncbi:MAG TPA: FMN-binding negative transcriptional regulator [Rhizomicrobium sp.]|nr:FMN-binding negative transcriptional regulator [Rhizomicrobium sp.]
MTDYRAKFPPNSESDLVRLIERHPLAWVVSQGTGESFATPLPIRPALSPDDSLTVLRGHFARSNPQVAALRNDGRAQILFMGPHGYVSPSWMADRTQAPTWNYASAQFAVTIELFDDAAKIEELLRDLIGAMEADRPKAWSPNDMGARFASLSRGIVGFDAGIVEASGRFKLGQDERDDIYADIHRGLAGERATELLSWMDAFNPSRKP